MSRQRPIMFHRTDVFYLTEYPVGYSDWQAEADRNPGTLKITDAISGAVLWEADRDRRINSTPTGEQAP